MQLRRAGNSTGTPYVLRVYDFAVLTLGFASNEVDNGLPINVGVAAAIMSAIGTFA